MSLLLGLGLASAFLTKERCVAQIPTQSAQVHDVVSGSGRPKEAPTWSGRLAVRPREIATNAITMQSGEYWLDSLPFPEPGRRSAYPVYVPPQCAGPKRCPLLIWLQGGGGGTKLFKWLRPVADKHAIIVSSPWSLGGGWSMLGEHDRQNLDAAVRQLLQNFPVDPEKIALLGRCDGGPAAAFWGGDNLDVFSRVLVVSGAGATSYPITATVDPPNHTTEFFLDDGILEGGYGTIRAAQELRRVGHPVKLVLGLRDHEHQNEDYDFIGQWLQMSWAQPAGARHAPEMVTDSLPLLTTEALHRLTAFWTRFMQEPDSIRTTARQAHLREVVVPIGEERPSVVMVNMPALAANYPSVAAALEDAGLTAQQHDAYRAALASAIVAKSLTVDLAAALARPGMADERAQYSVPAVVIQPNSVQSKNVAFLSEHPDEATALDATGTWHTP